MSKTEKSKAEIYREERKARISASAKKSAKKKAVRNPKLKKVLGRIVVTVLVIAIAGAACWGIIDATGVLPRLQTALTVGETKVSVAEYSYIYYVQYYNTLNQSYQAQQQYGYDVYGFDYTASPEDQDSPYTDDDGNKLRWSEYLINQTVDFLQEFYVLYTEAVAEGYKVDEEDIAEIDETIESYRSEANGTSEDSGTQSIAMSLNSYLKLRFGEGVTEGFLRDIMERQTITQKYSEAKQQSFEDTYTDEILDKEYNEDPDKYDAVDLRKATFTIETLTAEDGESEEDLAKRQTAANAELKKQAEEFLGKVTDEKSFLAAATARNEADTAADDTATEDAAADDATADETAEPAAEETTEPTAEETTEPAAEETTDVADDTAADDTTADDAAAEEEAYDADTDTKLFHTTSESLTSSVSEDAATWAFEDGRKAGDKKLFETATAYQVLYLAKTQYPLETVDVRHILFMTVDSESGEALSDEEIIAKKESADSTLEKWNTSDTKTAEYFGELAHEFSEDTGSSENGGLYEGVTPGQMVSEFDEWIFDAGRKEGDTDIILSDYGYHIMYYVGNKNLSYRNSLRTSHTQDDYSGWLEEELALDAYKIVKNDANMQKGYDRAYVLIDTYVKNIQDNAASNAAVG